MLKRIIEKQECRDKLRGGILTGLTLKLECGHDIHISGGSFSKLFNAKHQKKAKCPKCTKAFN